MLGLVVIFILAAPLLASSIRLELPRAASAQPGVAASAISVVLDKAGEVFVNDAPVAADARMRWPSASKTWPHSSPTPNCSCAPTPPCPMAAWSRSSAWRRLRGWRASALRRSPNIHEKDSL